MTFFFSLLKFLNIKEIAPIVSGTKINLKDLLIFFLKNNLIVQEIIVDQIAHYSPLRGDRCKWKLIFHFYFFQVGMLLHNSYILAY